MYINNINNNNNDNNNSNNSNNKILIIITNTTKTKRHTASTIFPSISLYWELCLSTIFSNQSSLNLISTFTDFAVVEWRSLLENYFQRIYYHINNFWFAIQFNRNIFKTFSGTNYNRPISNMATGVSPDLRCFFSIWNKSCV